MKRPPIVYALKRSTEILHENPRKLLFMLQPMSLWKKFQDLLTEGRVKTVTKSEFLALQRAKKRDFKGEGWSHQPEGVSVRAYKSYQDYTRHQQSKLEELGGEAFVDPQKAVQMFLRRFADAGLRKNSTILCLGARRGEEVEAFRRLGHFAVGIDLNPGADNKNVLAGDFHSLSFADSSVDAVYTNCLDHAFDIDKIAREVNRVLKPEGSFVVDIVYGFEEGYTVGNHDTMHWPTAKGFAELLAAKGGLQLIGFRDLKDVGSASWCQAQLTKS